MKSFNAQTERERSGSVAAAVKQDLFMYEVIVVSWVHVVS